MRPILPAVVMALASLAQMGSSCPGNPFGTSNSKACRNDAQCGLYKKCDVASGQCKCLNDRACGDGEFCNAVSQCQALTGCQDNADCEEQGQDLICNVKTGQCSAAGVCLSDAHCPLNHICSDQTGACVEACRDESDCVLGSGCIRAQPNDPLGHCRANACSRTQDCAPGRNCDLVTNTCVVDQRGPFCGPCQNFDPNRPECGDDPANYCLVDTGDPLGNSHFCGVDCSQDQGCPSGYECSDVIIVGPPATPQCGVEICSNNRCTTNTGVSCSRDEDCPMGPPGGDCARGREGICAGTVDQRCTSDTDCGGAAGSCHKATCSGGENAAFGFCSCVIDADCPADTCRGADLTVSPPRQGHCFLSGHRCYDETDCSVIACVNGGCLIGRNCAPNGDRRCAELTP